MPITVKVKKGDTLNKIAQQHGFTNFREAGVSSVPSGNFDLIREGEDVTLGNFDPNKITGIKEGSPVISSLDNEQQFKDDSTRVDDITTSLAEKLGIEGEKEKKEDASVTKTTTDQFGNKVETKVDTGEKKPTPSDKIDLDLDESKKALVVEKARKQTEYNNLYTTSLANIDASVASTINDLNASFGRRIDEQERINDLNIARTKAYGLAGGGRFVPLSFSDSITRREIEAADKINDLERQRNNAIAKARNARDTGRSRLLRQNLEDLDNIDEDIRTQLSDLKNEAEAQHKLLRESREEEEEKREKLITQAAERLTSLAPQFSEEFEKMSDEEQDNFLTEVASQTGLSYAEVFGIMKSGGLDIRERESKIEATEALTEQRKAAAAKSLRSSITGEDDFSDSETKKLKQAGLQNADSQTKLDFLFGTEDEKEEALLKSEKKEEETTKITFKAPNGSTVEFTELSEEEIKELKDGGYIQQ